MPPSPLAKAREVTQQFNIDRRFGQVEAMELVAPEARDKYVADHRAWGSGVRIADVEVEGVKAKGDHEAEAFVQISWYRPTEQELRTTTVKQTWRDKSGWLLVAEQRAEGDFGLLGDDAPPLPLAVAAERPAPVQFPTVRLDGHGGAPSE